MKGRDKTKSRESELKGRKTAMNGESAKKEPNQSRQYQQRTSN
jgi:hypothetical protein